MLSGGVPRVRLQAMWRVPEAFLERAKDEATLVAIRDMERAGIDIVSDGEIRRESYWNRFGDRLTVWTPSRRARPAMAPGTRSAGLDVGEALG
jgi:hypothetical protein